MGITTDRTVFTGRTHRATSVRAPDPRRFPLGRTVVPALLLPALFLVLLATGCDEYRRPAEVATNLPESDPDAVHATTIAPAGEAPRILIETPTGSAAVPCGTCHRTREENRAIASAEDLQEFHTEFEYAHGGQTCISCHAPGGYDRLRLADGTEIPYESVMRLCRQCHGPQARDYDNGAHGGWSGHWDLESGPRVRNHCVHCHDPHVPAFPRMLPTFRPIDRFLDETEHGESVHGEEDRSHGR